MKPPPPGTRAALGAFALVFATHLGAQLAGAGDLPRWTQWLLMPTLAAAVVLAARGPSTPAQGHANLTRLLLVGLVFSWLGDTLPHFFPGAAFLVMVGMFALAQAAYATAFWPSRRASVLRTPWVLLYLASAACRLGLCLPHAGTLAGPVIGYAAIITAMAVLATGINRLTGTGGALFMLSDALIALDTFVPAWEVPGQGFWVMATYGLAQLLIVLGILRAQS